MAVSKKIILLLENVRSAYNVGALFRSADAFGAKKIVLVGISAYPKVSADTRPPHISERATKLIAKTALGAEKTLPFSYHTTLNSALAEFKNEQINIYVLEQAPASQPLKKFKPMFPCLLILGNEIDGVSKTALARADAIIEIPMRGHKESLNVAVAGSIALYQLSS